MKSGRSAKRCGVSCQPLLVSKRVFACACACSSAGKSAAETQADASLAGVVEKQLAERFAESLFRVRALVCCIGGEAGKGEFDVLAGAEIVGREIGAGAAVVARLRAADDDPVAAPAFGVEDGEIGKHGIVAQILESEGLLATELAAQAPFARRRSAGPPVCAGARGAVRWCRGRSSCGLWAVLCPEGLVMVSARVACSVVGRADDYSVSLQRSGCGLLPIIVRARLVPRFRRGEGGRGSSRVLSLARKLPSSCGVLKRRVFVFGNSP
jgi:hypothetical protein